MKAYQSLPPPCKVDGSAVRSFLGSWSACALLWLDAFYKVLILCAQVYYSLMSSLLHDGVLKCAYGLRLPIGPFKLFLGVRDIVLLFQN